MRVEIQDKNNFVKIFNQMYPKHKIQNINGVSIDSRIINQNDVFIPFKGDSFDGHRFIDDVLKKKGTICLSEKKHDITNRIIHTSSNKNALLNLASAWRKKMGSEIIAITGSNGKTDWMLYCGTFDGGTLSAYSNGSLDGSAAGITARVPAGNTVQLGADTTLAYYLKGHISTFRLYNRALASREVLQNFNAQRGRFGV